MLPHFSPAPKLLLQSALKETHEGHPDRVALENEALPRVRQVCAYVNDKVKAAVAEYKLRRLAATLDYTLLDKVTCTYWY
jgi:hypothetical protein